MNLQRIQLLALSTGAIYCGIAAADTGLLQRYQGYKQYQARGQQELLEQIREEAKDWKFDLAEEHLAAARNMAYAPDAIRAVERLIADNRTAKADKERREREEAQRQRREAEKQRQREEQERQAAQRSYASSGGSSSGGATVDWVSVGASCTGTCGGPSTLSIDLSGGPGIANKLTGAHTTLSPGYGGIAGTYRYQVTFGSGGDGWFTSDKRGLVCAGAVRVSGTKRNLQIRVYDNCSDSGTGEF